MGLDQAACFLMMMILILMNFLIFIISDRFDKITFIFTFLLFFCMHCLRLWKSRRLSIIRSVVEESLICKPLNFTSSSEPKHHYDFSTKTFSTFYLKDYSFYTHSFIHLPVFIFIPLNCYQSFNHVTLNVICIIHLIAKTRSWKHICFIQQLVYLICYKGWVYLL